MKTRRNPAVTAGLVGAAILVPQPALAASLAEAVSSVLGSPVACFGAGVLTGAVVSGVVSAVVCHSLMARDQRRSDAEFPAQAFQPIPLKEDFNAAAPAPAPARVDFAAAEDAPARKSGKHFHAADKEPAPEPQPVIGSHATDDYEQIAQNYVKKATLGARMATRAQGVAKTLRDRMGADMMDGLPVIERADGSVADVGTSWWNTSVGLASIAKIDDYVEGEDTDGLAIPSDFSETGKQMLIEAAQTASLRRPAHTGSSAPAPAAASEAPAAPMPAPAPTASPADEFTHGSIADRIAFVDEGVYPERRDADDSLADDDWASALKSMDERLNANLVNPEPVIPAPFEDIVGDADTLDEPDGLEQSTTFIPFKPLAGHPEVVDTESYVDYLIGDEFGHNSSKATRNAAGRFLRLLEGGTSTNALARSAGKTGTSSLHRADDSEPYRPKHMAMPIMKEA